MAQTSVVSSTEERGSRIGFVGKFKTGLKLSRDSIGVVRAHPKLLVFPALGALAALGFWIVFLLPLWIGGLIGSGVEYLVLFLLYFATTFATTFFTAALVFAVNQAFHGEEPRLGESIRAAWRRKTPILVWAAVAATVSVLLKKLQESDNMIARLLSSVFALGWTVMTFFIVPVIVFEEVTVTSMFSRSAETFRDTWGESLGVGLGVTLIQFVIAIVGVLVAIALAVVLGAVVPVAGLVFGIVLVAGVLVGAFLLGQTIWAITKTALYVYAAEERIPEQFADFDFETLDGRTEQTATPGHVKNPRLHLNE
jgi:hypothetical protein